MDDGQRLDCILVIIELDYLNCLNYTNLYFCYCVFVLWVKIV